MELNKYNFQFVIENGYKTSYITSLLSALFFKSNNNIENILNNNPDNPSAIYLQELIKDNFVEPIRKNFTINNSNINEIRNYIIINNYNLDNFTIKQEDIGNFYKFIIDYLCGEYIEFEIFKIIDNSSITTDKNINLSYIPLNPTCNITIKQLFINWLNKYINKNNTFSYKLMNIPSYLCFYINRFYNDGKRNNYEVDIMKKIKFFNTSNSSQKFITWKIHSIICNEGDNFEKSHYYSINLDFNNNWIMINTQNIPTLKYIDMSDDDTIDKIRKECMFIIYVIND